MFENVLSKDAKKALALLAESKILKNAYLAGGSACALQINHRFSDDFDFFTKFNFDEKIMVQRVKKILPSFQLERMSVGTILGYIGDIRFSLFFYDYPLLFKLHNFLRIKIADIKDIAPMKIAAISDRGTKRDFIDLYFIMKIKKILTLEEVLNLYDKKFKALEQNKLHLIKSLVYFDDAERDEEPKMINKIDWNEIKEYFEKEVKRISKKIFEVR